MSVPLELIGKYTTTFLDFWLLRPRRFLAQPREEKARYLPASQFAGMSVALIAVLLAIAYSNSHADLETLAHSPMAPPEALAGRLIVFCIVILFLNVPFYRLISRPWPIKGSASFTSIFEFQCYTTALLVPFALLDVLVDPITIHFASHGGPLWLLFAPFFVGCLGGIPLYFLYQNPGIAKLNGISSLRMYLGTVLWWAVLETVLIFFVLLFVFAYYIPHVWLQAAKQRQLGEWVREIDFMAGEPLVVGVKNDGMLALMQVLALSQQGKNAEAARLATQKRLAFSEMAVAYQTAAKTIREKPLPPLLNGAEAERAFAIREHFAESCEENATAFRSLANTKRDNYRAALNVFEAHSNQSSLLANQAREAGRAVLETLPGTPLATRP